MAKEDLVVLGKINGLFGLKGWLKVFSYTEPRENILSYEQLTLLKGVDVKPVKLTGGQLQGKNVVIHVEGVDDRDQAQLLVGYEIAIKRSQFPELAQNEYYWTDLIGLDVENLEAVHLGKVESLFETGSNDVMLVKGDRERALPFIQGQTIKSIDLKAGKILVDWDADF